MDYKTTNKGTELPLLNLKGKPYLQVAHRLVWFREEHPMGRIVTSIVQLADKHAIAKAEIYVVGQRPGGDPFEVLMSTAHKKEEASHFPDFIEKAETGAIGRALAMAGYGTQFDPELDEGVRLADAPIAPAKKAASVESAVESSAAPKAALKTSRATIDASITKTSEILLKQSKMPIEEQKALLNTYGVNSKAELTDDQATELLSKLKEKL
jgi:hypothetical protein